MSWFLPVDRHQYPQNAKAAKGSMCTQPGATLNPFTSTSSDSLRHILVEAGGAGSTATDTVRRRKCALIPAGFLKKFLGRLK